MKAKYIACLLMAFVFVGIVAGCGDNKDNKETDSQKTAPAVQVDTALRTRLEAFAKRPRPQGKFAFMVYDITARKEVYGCNQDMALPSASCMKLLSGIAGLKLLGCDYKYHTAMSVRGKVGADGMLNGDVAFCGSLDPQLMAPDLTNFAKALRDKSVRKIGGKFIVDLVIKDPVQSERHWFPWDLSFSKYGLLYKGEDRIIKALKSAVRAQGIAVADSQIVVAEAPEGFSEIYAVDRNIEDVVSRMWKNSSNTQSTAMLYTIGHKFQPDSEPVKAGVLYLKHFLRAKLKHRDSRLAIHDGCGLCVYNRLSPRALTGILEYGYNDVEIRGMLERNLSVSGVDGTLAREMCGPRLRGKIKAKTGTLSHPYGISSLAGLCDGANGHKLAFAIMDSEMSVLDARVLQRKLCEELVKGDK